MQLIHDFRHFRTHRKIDARMAPRILETLGDLWAIVVDFVAIWTDVKKDEILKSLQKAPINEKKGPRVAENSHRRDRRSDGRRVHAARVR